LWGRVREGGISLVQILGRFTPTPAPSPQGGREHAE
jgi:hypothetical protein